MITEGLWLSVELEENNRLATVCFRNFPLVGRLSLSVWGGEDIVETTENIEVFERSVSIGSL